MHRIEVVPEGSDIAAQVRESSEIRRLRPAVNVQRAVRERELHGTWRGDRVVILPAARGAGREVLFIRGGQVVDRRPMSPGPAARRRAEALLGRYYFGEWTQPPLPGMAGKRPGASARPGISPRLAQEASRLLASWTRRRGGGVLSFDPGEAAGPKDAARRLLAYLEIGPSEGLVIIR